MLAIVAVLCLAAMVIYDNDAAFPEESSLFFIIRPFIVNCLVQSLIITPRPFSLHKYGPTLTSPIADAVGIADSVGKNHCISIADTLSLKIYGENLLHKQ